MFARVENGVTKSCQIFAGKTGKTQFWPDVFHCFEQDRLLCARVVIGVTEYPTKTAKEEEGILSVCLIFFSKDKSGCAKRSNCAPLEIFIFCRGKTDFWGGYNFITG